MEPSRAPEPARRNQPGTDALTGCGRRAGIRRTNRSALAALLLLTVPGPARAAPPQLPPPFTARYSGAYGLVEAQVRLAQVGRFLKHEYRSTVARHTFYECSVIEVAAEDFWPLEFVHRQVGATGTKDYRVVFARGERRVTIIQGERKRVVHDVDYPVWDPLSVQLRMIADLAAGALAPHYALVSKDGIEQRRFRQGPRETVSLSARDYAAVRIERVDKPERSYVAVAPELHHLPVRIGYNAKWVGWVHATITELTLQKRAAYDSSPQDPPRCAMQ